MKKPLKIVLGLGLLGFVAIQVDALADLLPKVRKEVHLDRPADRTGDPAKSLEAVTAAPEDIRKLLSASCNDCHSAKTVWPWYSHVAPMKWLVIEHVVQGRKKFDFATFGDESSEDQAHRLEECAEEVGEKHMPIDNYTWLHPEAKLSDDDRRKLVAWFNAEAAKRK